MNADINKLKELAEWVLKETSNCEPFYVGDLVRVKDSAAEFYGFPKGAIGFVSYDYDSERDQYEITILDLDGDAETFVVSAWMIELHEEEE